jgi:hypothetical protein
MKLQPKMIECPDCEGEGKVWEDTSRQCTKTPWQECCGGCGVYCECEKCNGTGEVEQEDDIFSVGDKFKYLGLDAIITNVEVSIYSGITYTIFIECSGVTLAVNSLSETLKNR